METDETSSKSSRGFFYTLPGIITGIAAFITAVGGLIIALNQTGCFGTRKEVVAGEIQGQSTAPVNDNTSISKQATETKDVKTANSNISSVSGNAHISYSPEKVDYSLKQVTFAIKEANVAPLPNNQSLYKVKVKCINEGSNGFAFGFGNVRVKIDEDKYVPDDASPGPWLQSVDGHSFKMYEFYFKLPSNSKKFDLLFYDAKDEVGTASFEVG